MTVGRTARFRATRLARRAVVAASVAGLLLGSGGRVLAHSSRHGAPKAAATAKAKAQERERKLAAEAGAAQPAAGAPAPQTPDSHQGAVTLAASEVGGTDLRSADDIRAVLAPRGISVVPTLEPNIVATLRGLAASPLVDAAVARLDALEEARAEDPNLPKRIGYLARLFDEEIAILSRPGLTDVRELDGRKVGVGEAGSSSWACAKTLFARLGLHPVLVEQQTSAALDALDAGTLDAVVVVDGKPASELFAPRAGGVHILSIPYQPTLQDLYYPAQLTHQDYPRLVPQRAVDTVAVATVLVAPLDGGDDARDRRLLAFTQAFLTNFGALQKDGRYPKWRDVNLAAETPGWTRIDSAARWLDAADADDKRAFDAYLAAKSTPPPTTEAARQKLFQEFVTWNSMRAR